MTSWDTGHRPISIAILAMGGEGGGVLADWIVAVGRAAGYHAQTTSVAGVAQRTGATVYYVELYPPGGAGGVRSEPVLSLFPTPGEVDVVIASELMEAGRAVQRGFTTPDRTTLIASTNRVYSMDERLAPGDGRVDSTSLLDAARAGSKRLVAEDFMALALQAGSVISASLFGALAGCGVVPVERSRFEDAIRAAGKGVDASLRAFAAGYDAAQAPPPVAAPRPRGGAMPLTLQLRRPVDPEEAAAQAEEQRRREVAASDPHSLVGPALRAQAGRVVAEFPAGPRDMLLQGLVRTAVYQDTAYADRYLDRVARLVPLDPEDAEGLITEAARHTALWMTYQDTIHVAHQKIRRRRLQGVRDEAGAKVDQLVDVKEYLHPQVEEITDTLPTALGRRLARSKVFAKIVGRATRDGLVVNTTGIAGYSMLWTMAHARPFRPRSLRFNREQDEIETWLDRAVELGRRDPGLARQVIECQQVLKGYGATHAHGRESFDLIMSTIDDHPDRAGTAAAVRRLRGAALADEDGSALRAAVATATALHLTGVDARGPG